MAKVEKTENIMIEFSIKDRLLVMSYFLPKEGNILIMTMVNDIRSKLELTQNEIKKYDVREIDGGRLMWKEPTNKKQFTFSTAELEMLRSGVSKLDKNSKVTPELLSLCLVIRGK